MLMTALKGELAVKQSKTSIRMFKRMKVFIIKNHDFVEARDFVPISIQNIYFI